MDRERRTPIKSTLLFVQKTLTKLTHCFMLFAVLSLVSNDEMQRIARFLGAQTDVTIEDMLLCALSSMFLLTIVSVVLFSIAEER